MKQKSKRWVARMNRKKIYQECRLYTNRYGLTDLISVTDPLFVKNRESFDNYSNVFDRNDGYSNPNYSRERVVRKIITTFLDLLIRDMIHENITFHFPIPSTIKLRIATSKNPKNFSKEIFKQKALPWMILGRNFMKRSTGFYFYMILNGKYRKILIDEQLNGHHYPPGIPVQQNIQKIDDISDLEEYVNNNKVNDIE